MENNDLKDPLRHILQLLKEILAKLEGPEALVKREKTKLELMEDLVDSIAVKRILDVGDSTVYRIKKSGKLTTKRIGKRDYYSLAEINKIADFYKK